MHVAALTVSCLSPDYSGIGAWVLLPSIHKLTDVSNPPYSILPFPIEGYRAFTANGARGPI